MTETSGRVPRLGIGIITYKRPELVRQVVAAVQKYTSHPYALIVADDGSGAEVTNYITEFAPVITGANHGVTWNKNRALFYLKSRLDCDVVILLEDDILPLEFGWELPWVIGTRRWGHANYAGPWFKDNFLEGDGTTTSPYLSKAFSGQCTSFSREALDYVGFLDTRYRGYGVGHVDHTHRLARSGYGAIECPDRGMLFQLLSGHLRTLPSVSAANEQDLSRNIALYETMDRSPIYRSPWKDNDEQKEFREEQHAAPYIDGAFNNTRLFA